MPILEVQIVGPMDSENRAGLAGRIARAAGGVLGAEPGRTWVRLRFVEAADYAEDTASDARPVFVSVLRATLPEGEAMAEEVARLTKAIAGACDRPESNVHVIYEPAARGRVAFGGRLVD